MLEGEEGDLSDDDLKNEVFSLGNLGEQSQSDEDDSEELEDVPEDSEVDLAPTPKTKKTKATGAKKATNDLVESSSGSEDEADRLESWGRKKSAYYSTNAASIESDDEEAQRLEEAEVNRLQTLARASLQEDDFGVNDAPPDSLVEEAAAPVPIAPLSQDPEVLIRHLEKTSPETLALAREWEDVVYDLAQSQRAVDRIDKSISAAPAVGMLQLYHQTLLTYATTLAFYLHMRAQPKYATNPKLLQAHPVLARLLSLKQAMSSLERLDFGPNSDGSEEEEDSDDSEVDEEEDMRFLWGDRDLAAMDENEFEDLLRDAQEVPEPTVLKAKKKPKKSPVDGEVSQKKKEKKRKSKAPVFDLEEPEFVPASALNGVSKSKSKSKAMDGTSAFGEYTSLDATDAQDKSARKKSLRFHTSRIESAASRRANARGAAMQGDNDIPYREREKQREEREAKESKRRAEKGLLGAGGEDLEEESVGRGVKRPRDEEDEGDVGVDGYYELVKRQKREEKAEKQAQYDAQKAAEKAAREGDDLDDGQGGPRSLTRAILKNKGLTPSRSKSVRNPRVKKRMKYDEAKKKIRSQKAVYKGGLASTGGKYLGEASGISTRVVKSVKLG
ncbi:hypothetical protein M408DRAFT_279574 [Serendipita vermifera MAFF 305830]|uniref:Sas10 C-terminal domain-containing protein n=1 Tax=Serendipita vermifera MAFF 305830 TaxID=933852 RepID=A0A0C2W8M0_SERVB|nr:hypothetical protein M408DRAFT_279574 [Serendipita vermifera MAFF 305830]